ncbi:hypothetical protein J1766_gp65 [Gordonia phage Bizzy]|uniref:Uncharacterized protein n=1 Tax=Gordonia phage Bizzy TaxID=2483667 RepID=A0A3G3M8C6_9CAUD|nr:hypothetical protein J1766_gp65 [Gordonia phage Bizzy]AYR02701.1 hypothetical protein SEA_BIZZY_65 [Gordonia phage Bizzy]URP21132.1 hypothetical protein SEA_FLATWOODS_65 [Gordonia phage Flatwoods]
MTVHPNVFADTQNRLCVHSPRTSLDKAPYVLGAFDERGHFIEYERVGEIPDGFYWAGAGARDLTAERRRRIEKREKRAGHTDDQAFDSLIAGLGILADVVASLTNRYTAACEDRDEQRVRAEAAEYDLAELRRTKGSPA